MEQLTQFNAGGSHSENQNGGIPQGIASNGQPNLVEEGETKLNAENYVFSDRLVINKELSKQYNLPTSSVGKTFAQVSKKLNLPNSRRENDSIEENDKKKNLDKLMYAQEDFKQKELELDIMAMMEKHPELATMMPSSYAPQEMIQQPTEEVVDPNTQPQEEPMMAKGGYMYNNGGKLMRGIGTALNTAAPYLSKIPGVGIIASVASGAIGAGLQNVGTGANFGEVALDSAFGAGKGVAGTIPGGAMLLNGLQQQIDPNEQKPNSFPDGGKLETTNNPHYKEQMKLYNEYNNPASFNAIARGKVQHITGDAVQDWYNTELKNNPENNLFIGGYKPKEVYLDEQGSYYPVYNEPSKTINIPPTITSDINKPFIKPMEEPVVTEQPKTPMAYRNQTIGTIDPKTNKWVYTNKSVPYYQGQEGGSGFAGGEQVPNAPIVWIDAQGQQHTTQPQTFANGGDLDTSSLQTPFIGPQNYQQPVVDPNFNPAMQYPLNYDQANLYPSLETTTPIFDDYNVEEEGARMLAAQDGVIDESVEEEPYKSRIDLANETLTDNNQDLRVQQSKGQALAELAPVAYNLGMGIFSKPTNLNPDDYLGGTKITAPEIDVTPQVREGQQSYATAQNSIANSGVVGGAYLTNLQQLAANRNKNLGQIYTQKENIDAQNKMQADQFNASMAANNNQTRFQIEDYNARAKGAKQAMLQEGIGQVADLAKNKTANKLATSYYSLNAPDFAGQVGYTSYWDYLKNKKAEKNTNE